jgi:hypothetical protein
MSALDLAPIQFFLSAGEVGKFVMLLLFAASIWCWVLIVEGIVGAVRLKISLRKWRRGQSPALLTSIVDVGQTAADLRLPGESIGETRTRIIEAMNREARSVLSRIEGGLVNLAVIASVSPFIGLFGTVWGIMSSFTAIAAAKDTSLAIVAPGIAEALATTAIGLAAAIPASIGYTRIGAAIGSAAQILAGFIEEEALHAVTPQSVRRHGLKEVV